MKDMPTAKKTTKKIDYKKEFPDLYNPSAKECTLITIPPMKYFMLDGKGDPNISQEFQDAMPVLYGASFTLKMKEIKKKTPTNDYVVPPLEGLWYMPNMSEWSMDAKSKWLWTLMIRIPDFAMEDQLKRTVDALKQKLDLVSLPKLRIETYNEGLCVQIMHIGPYDAEPPTIAKMHKFAKDNGYKLDGKHHEIYLGDPRKGNPEKVKTVLRQPISKKINL
jgi:hypothetical protein